MIRNTPELKQLNKELIRKEIQKNGKCTKNGVSRETSLSLATCNTIFNEMLADGEIIQADYEESYMGRPASNFTYNADYHHVLGMYVSNESGADTIEYAVADALGRQIRREQIKLPITYELIEELVNKQIQQDALIQRMTLGIPGISTHGVIESCDVKSIIGVDMEGKLQSKYGINVEIRNDMDFLATGVYSTIAHDGGNLATIYMPPAGKGCIGCGLVIGGTVLRGHSKFAGEISYVPEAFGISRMEQEKLFASRPALCDLTAKMIIIVTAMIDPETIMLLGDDITADDLPAIREVCNQIIPESHVPSLLIDNKIFDYYINGLIGVALHKLQFPLSDAL